MFFNDWACRLKLRELHIEPLTPRQVFEPTACSRGATRQMNMQWRGPPKNNDNHLNVYNYSIWIIFSDLSRYIFNYSFVCIEICRKNKSMMINYMYMYEYSVLLTTLTYGGGHFISPEGSASQT